MHHVQGWSFAEIAERLGIRLNAAKTRAFRGMRKMREQIVAGIVLAYVSRRRHASLMNG
jgi:DNA-directed RNA polymerase specialized sigma24 family protein